MKYQRVSYFEVIPVTLPLGHLFCSSGTRSKTKSLLKLKAKNTNLLTLAFTTFDLSFGKLVIETLFKEAQPKTKLRSIGKTITATNFLINTVPPNINNFS